MKTTMGAQMISYQMMQPREYFSSRGRAESNSSEQGDISPTFYYSR